MDALRFEHVSKHYRGAQAGQTVRDEMTRRIRSVARGARAQRPTLVNALDDVTFSIADGEPTALIGANGAGKTTALKLATRIAFPTSGRIRVRGRVAALIEVGNGLHPELTGRENIILYGRILGFSRADIARRFDAIVEFSGVADALDRPLKQYSSGMQLRLGFSVAAHLEPDILLVDEAIAVGDAGFQYRCMERMSELVRGGGTLVLVSHDMGAIETLCSRVLMLEHGHLVEDGAARDVVARYLAGFSHAETRRTGEGPVRISSVELENDDGTPASAVAVGDALTVRVHYVAREPIERPIFTIGINDGRAGAIAVATTAECTTDFTRLDGHGWVQCRFDELPLRSRPYEVWCSVRHASGHGDVLDWQRIGQFRVVDDADTPRTPWTPRAPVLIRSTWTFESAATPAGRR